MCDPGFKTARLDERVADQAHGGERPVGVTRERERDGMVADRVRCIYRSVFKCR